VMIIAGAGDDPDVLREHNILAALRETDCHCDVKIVYYTGPAYVFGTLTDSMHEDATQGAAAGYDRRVWVGISAGGMAALEMARLRPHDVDALVLVSPYLGSKFTVDEIERAGGLATWSPIEPIEDLERMWEYVQGYAREGVSRPPTTLMYGEADPNQPAQQLMASVLNDSQLYVTDGDHEWATFTALWKHYLQSKPAWIRASQPD